MSEWDKVVENIRELEAERTKYKNRLVAINALLEEPVKTCEARRDFAWDSQYPLRKYRDLVYSIQSLTEEL